MSMVNALLGHSPEELRRQARRDMSGNMRRRRGTMAVSLLGIGAMALTTMLQRAWSGACPIRRCAASTPSG